MKRRRGQQLRHQRVALALLGAVLLGVAGVGLLLSFELLERVTDWAVVDQPVLNDQLTDSVAGASTTVAAASAAVGVLLVLIGLLWLRSQVPPRRRHEDVSFDADVGGVDGLNVVDGGALAAALEDDLERHPDVMSAVAEMRPEHDLVRLTLVTAEQASAAELRREVIDPAIGRAVRVAQLERTPRVEVDLRLEERARIVA